MENTEEYEELIKVSMSIILHAGNAQTIIQKAINKIEENDFSNAKSMLENADTEIVKAHSFQTDMIQSEARGEKIEYLSLFSHAQDTLMTVKSELKLVTNLLGIFENINSRLNKMEEMYENN